MEDVVIEGEALDGEHGITRPRLFTLPLRPLTKETSNGFAVIAFAAVILKVTLFPWQCWLLIHALELNEDGSYRFRRVIVLVARQNGKTTVMGVLIAWWLFIDSAAHPDRVPPVKFAVVGAAQTLDNAKGPYETVKAWCNPEPASDQEIELAVPMLQKMVQRINRTNGEEGIQTYSKASYIVRAALNIRSKSAARAVFDELREQHNDDGWNAVSQITKAVWSSQLWGISNAGDHRSKVLKRQVDKGRALIDDWHAWAAAHNGDMDGFASTHDTTYGYFEWSAPDGCACDDRDAIRQANPSVGYGAMSVSGIASDIDGMTESAYRTEVLCQWVTADVKPSVDPKRWKRLLDPDSAIPDGNRVVLSIDTSADRQMTYISAAGLRADGLPHVELIARRTGMMWALKYLERLHDTWPDIHEIAIQSKGCAAVDYVDPLTEAGWTVHPIEGFKLGACTGRFNDHIRDGRLRHLDQPALDQQVDIAVTKRLGELEVFDRVKSAMHISALIACAQALYALETTTGDEGKPKLKPSTGIRCTFT